MTDDRDPFLAARLGSLTPPEHGARFWDELDDSLNTGSEPSRWSRSRSGSRWWAPSRSLLAAAAALVLVSAAGIGLALASRDNGTELETGPAGPGGTPPPTATDADDSDSGGTGDDGPTTEPPEAADPGDDLGDSSITSGPTSTTDPASTPSSDTTDGPSTTTSTTTASDAPGGTGTSPATGSGGTCTAQTLTNPVISSGQPWSALASEIQRAALVCDYDRLAELAAPDNFTYSFGGGGDFAGYLRDAEARGEDPTRKLVLLLGASPGQTGDGEPTPSNPHYVVWPAFFACEAECGMDEAEVRRLGYSDSDIEAFRAFGSYGGYRVGFAVYDLASEFSWVYFVAGD